MCQQGEIEMRIVVRKLSKEQARAIGIYNWPESTITTNFFTWHHESKEECYLTEGEVEISTPDGQKTIIKAGDFVVFPKGLSCICHVKRPVRRHTRTY